MGSSMSASRLDVSSVAGDVMGVSLGLLFLLQTTTDNRVRTYTHPSLSHKNRPLQATRARVLRDHVEGWRVQVLHSRLGAAHDLRYVHMKKRAIEIAKVKAQTIYTYVYPLLCSLTNTYIQTQTQRITRFSRRSWRASRRIGPRSWARLSTCWTWAARTRRRLLTLSKGRPTTLLRY